MAAGDYWVDENGDYLVDENGDYMIDDGEGSCCCEESLCSSGCSIFAGRTIRVTVPEQGFSDRGHGCGDCDTAADFSFVEGVDVDCTTGPVIQYLEVLGNCISVPVRIACNEPTGKVKLHVNPQSAGVDTIFELLVDTEDFTTGEYSLPPTSWTDPCPEENPNCHCSNDGGSATGQATLTIT